MAEIAAAGAVDLTLSSPLAYALLEDELTLAAAEEFDRIDAEQRAMKGIRA
ncbi:hypothetical protein [Microbacterium sp. NIBRBAC000506063]|uniref:hypothetical protein n=1 Tax=Microbacterium sp. NIBRBAC000506063 TaxID=2734618 RepID=UPI001BB5477E|nr:hypothetical protein [Microbacterium sp. NIBRBAC000506063]QTV80130.1 hypothetical protein KAE78_03395 [Microbacterium sp. NIBRBAC000506063]